ncbi:MAG: serine hydrolase domain-containing protein [Actinomycetota bacterium]|nr:serine hydrolase domain-containing protein [Actinomycetota bacterium]
MSTLERRHVADAAAYFDRWLEFRCTADRVPGVQAAVLYDDEVVLSAAHGVADVSTGEALTENHLFRIASHSKTFTATAVMQLVERGTLRLDDSVGERIVELASSPIAAVTIRELLSHAGGVVRDGWDGDFWQLDRAFPDRAELLRIAADDSAVLARNERFKYSNIGYSLLGLIIEQVSGTPFRDYVTEHVIGPLGLSDTGPDLDEARRGDYAAGHTALAYAERRIPIDHIDTGAMSAATGLYSTASDLVRYAAAHFEGDDRLVGAESKRQMQHGAWKVDGTESEYGFGFEIVTIGGRRLLGHGGGYPGHITRTWFDPKDRLAVCVFTNAIDGPALGMATAAIKLVDLARGSEPDPAATGDGAVDLDSFCGRFASLWSRYDIAVLGGRLYQLSPSMVDPTLMATRLDVVDADTLRIADTIGFGSHGEVLTFERHADGSIRSVRGGSGAIAHPIDHFRAAIAGRDRITLGVPIRPG